MFRWLSFHADAAHTFVAILTRPATIIIPDVPEWDVHAQRIMEMIQCHDPCHVFLTSYSLQVSLRLE